MEVRPLSAEYYRQQANRLRVDAENVYDLTTRNELRDLARKYEALADGVERLFNHFSKPPMVQALARRLSSDDGSASTDTTSSDLSGTPSST